MNLSTPVDKAAAVAAHRATVVSGDARFEVLTDGVIRLEYSPTGKFVDDPTFDVLYRNFAVPRYTSSVRQGWLTLRTSSMVLRYKVGSGPFSTVNTQVQLLGKSANGTSVAAPTWTGECTFGQVCQSGASTETGAATIGEANHTGYVSAAGFISGYSAAGADATWQVLGASAGAGQITVRYSNGNTASRTMSLVVNGRHHAADAADDAELERLVDAHRPGEPGRRDEHRGRELRRQRRQLQRQHRRHRAIRN